MTQNYPEFKVGYKYTNIGNVCGTLNYAKELKRKDDSPYGWEFLLNAKGFGSINIRIPMLAKGQASLDNFPIADKPRVRAGLARIEQFTTDAGRTYTSATTFIELAPAVTAAGEEMKDNIAGRVAGEVFNIGNVPGKDSIKFSVVSYPVDHKDENKRATTGNGTPVDPNVLTFEVVDPDVIHQVQQTVRNGSNIEVGYKYLNKTDTSYDEYGFVINGETIERLEAGKVIVHGAPQAPPNNGFNGNQQFGQQQQGSNQGFGQQPGGPFNQNNYQQQPQGFNQNNDAPPFPPNPGFGQQQQDPFAQEANQFFGNNNNQGPGFGFGN